MACPDHASVSRILRWSANGFLVLVSVLVALSFSEIGARIYLQYLASESTFRRYATTAQLSARFGTQQNKFSPHPYLRFYLTPNYAVAQNRHNALGYRGPDIQQKRAGEYRIVCLGGSTTYTSRVKDYRKSYPALLEKHLKSMGYRRVSVINAGTPGWSTWETLVNFQFRVLDLDPDLVIVYHAVNDVGPRLVWPPEAYRGDNTGSLTAANRLRSAHRLLERSTLIRLLLIRLGRLGSDADLDWTFSPPAVTSKAGDFDRQSWRGQYPSEFFTHVPVDSILRLNQPIYYRRNLESLVSVARSRGIQVVLSTFAFLPWREHPQHSSWDSDEFFGSIEDANNLVRWIADSMGVRLFDFAEVFPRDKSLFATYERHGLHYVDPYHVNEEGANLKARLFADFLSETGLEASEVSTLGKGIPGVDPE